MCFFAAYLACITHVLLYNWRDIAIGFNSVRDSIKKGREHWFRSSREQFTDVHNRLMMECMSSLALLIPIPGDETQGWLRCHSKHFGLVRYRLWDAYRKMY